MLDPGITSDAENGTDNASAAESVLALALAVSPCTLLPQPQMSALFAQR